jgi:hypothetical protein
MTVICNVTDQSKHARHVGGGVNVMCYPMTGAEARGGGVFTSYRVF